MFNKGSPISSRQQSPLSLGGDMSAMVRGLIGAGSQGGGGYGDGGIAPQRSTHPSAPFMQVSDSLSSCEEISLRQMSLVILGTMTAETRIEEERIKLSEIDAFYPELAFNYLKHYTSHVRSAQSKGSVSSFFDFSIPNDVFEYSQLSSYRSGFVSYAQLLTFFTHFNVGCTDKVLEGIVKFYDPVEYSQGLSYNAFIQIMLSQSIPAARQRVLKKKIIYETQQRQQLSNQLSSQQLPSTILEIIATIFDLESNLITFTERAKVKIQNLLDNVSIQSLFATIDVTGKGFLDFNSLQQFFKRSKNPMLPNQFLALLRRLKKPDTVETISLNDFKELLAPNLPFFQPSFNQQTAINPEAVFDRAVNYSDVNKSQNISQVAIGSSFSRQAESANSYYSTESPSTTPVLFRDRQGRILEKNHPNEPVFLQENQQLPDMLKNNKNIVQHPNQDSVYALVPENYIERQPIFGSSQQQMQLLRANPQIKQGVFQPQYRMPSVDGKSLQGVDVFWQKPRSVSFSQQHQSQQQRKLIDQTQQLIKTNQSQSYQYGSNISPESQGIVDPAARRIIEEQQQVIRQQQELLSQQGQFLSVGQQQQQMQSMIGGYGVTGQAGVQQRNMNKQMLSMNPFAQDLLQMKHLNTSSCAPLAGFGSQQMRSQQQPGLANTMVIEKSFNAKINKIGEQSKLFEGQSFATGMKDTTPLLSHTIAKSTTFNPNLASKIMAGRSPNRQKIFDQQQDLSSTAQLNDRSYKFAYN